MNAFLKHSDLEFVLRQASQCARAIDGRASASPVQYSSILPADARTACMLCL